MARSPSLSGEVKWRVVVDASLCDVGAVADQQVDQLWQVVPHGGPWRRGCAGQGGDERWEPVAVVAVGVRSGVEELSDKRQGTVVDRVHQWQTDGVIGAAFGKPPRWLISLRRPSRSPSTNAACTTRWVSPSSAICRLY